MRAKPEGVPNLHGLTRVSVIAEGIRGEVDEREELDTNTRTQHNRLPSSARNTNSIEVAGKDLSVEVPQQDRQIEDPMNLEG